MLLLVPADPLRPCRPDEHFAAEATAARNVGHDVALIDHDALAEADGAEQAVGRVPAGGDGPAVYRGWMLTSGWYAAFADALTAKGVTLRTSTARPMSCQAGLPPWHRSPRLRHGQQAMPSRISARRVLASARVLRCYATTSSR